MAWTVPMLTASRTAMIAKLDAGSGGNARIKVYDVSNTLLATFGLDSPPGTLDGVTAEITLVPDATGNSISNAGTAAHATIEDGDGLVLADAIPVQEGTTASGGNLVLSSLNVFVGGSLTLVSATIG